jgi:hypothetical protein
MAGIYGNDLRSFGVRRGTLGFFGDGEQRLMPDVILGFSCRTDNGILTQKSDFSVSAGGVGQVWLGLGVF